MNISALTFSPVSGGRLGGMFALELVLGGQLWLSPADVLKRIRKALHAVTPEGTPPRVPLIVLVPNAIDVALDEASELLVTLREQGLTIIINSDGTQKPAWFSYANAHIATVRSADWLEYAVTELRYQPPEDDDWVEPPLGPANPSTPSYLAAGKAAGAKILQFITKAKRPWGVVAPAGVTTISFLKEEK